MKVGYHLTKIAKGKLGEPSKIKEECEEFIDAITQNCEVMAIVELSDMIGAIESYLEKHHPSISIDDLVAMKNATRRAFESGMRK